MKKKVFLFMFIVGLFSALTGFAQDSGIRFEYTDWEAVRKKAGDEKKLIFADFFTEWCGPCLAMTEEVFPLREVGDFYNTHFVNVKVDAEKGEGRTLREKYKVVSYPTFLFIDPKTGEVVHRSSSRQDAETFLFTGRSAVTPELRSFYLEKEYTFGNRERRLLKNYLDYLASVYQHEKVAKLAEEYVALPDFSLQKPEDWEVFVKHIRGIKNPQFREVAAQREKYAELYGQEEVDRKLYNEFNFSSEVTELENTSDFKGKSFLLRKNKAENYLRAKNYVSAIPLLDSLMADPGDFKEELCHYLKFTARSALYGEHPQLWIKKCAELAQYVAYNSSNRQDAGIHYDYAMLLEKLIRTLPEAGQYFPSSIVEQPEYGVKDYSLRSPKLKQKPRKIKK